MFNQKQIVITGASKGIGLAIAQRLQKPTHFLHLIGRTFAQTFAPQQANLYTTDLTSPEDLREFYKKLSRSISQVDVLINNAGMYIEKSLEETTLADIDTLIHTNLRSTILMTQALLPLLKNARSPLIINISSSAAKSAAALQTVYAATKAGLTAFADTLRKEVNSSNIRVTNIHPGGVNTWNAPDPTHLLTPEDLAYTVQHIINAHPRCQFSDIEMAAL